MYNGWTREFAEAFFERWVAEEGERRRQLRELVTATGGPPLEPTLDGLDALNVWHLERARVARDDPTPGRPSWARSTHPGVSDAFWRLRELLAQHVADVLRTYEPQARWVCFRSSDRRDDRNGKPMLDISWPANPVDVLVVANGSVYGAIYSGRPFDPEDLRREVQRCLTQLAEHRAGIWA